MGKIKGAGWTGFLTGLGAGIGLFLAVQIFYPDMLVEKYRLESEKEYIAFHVETMDFPMSVLDQMITVFENNKVQVEAIVFVKDRKPRSTIRLIPKEEK